METLADKILLDFLPESDAYAVDYLKTPFKVRHDGIDWIAASDGWAFILVPESETAGNYTRREKPDLHTHIFNKYQALPEPISFTLHDFDAAFINVPDVEVFDESQEKCWECGGSGESQEKCWECGGSGESECSHCGHDTVCEKCDGSGVITTKNIPTGRFIKVRTALISVENAEIANWQLQRLYKAAQIIDAEKLIMTHSHEKGVNTFILNTWIVGVMPVAPGSEKICTRLESSLVSA